MSGHRAGVFSLGSGYEEMLVIAVIMYRVTNDAGC